MSLALGISVWAISVCLSSHAVNTQQTAVEFFIFDRNAMFVVLFARAFASLEPHLRILFRLQSEFHFFFDCIFSVPFHICVLLLDPAAR